MFQTKKRITVMLTLYHKEKTVPVYVILPNNEFRIATAKYCILSNKTVQGNLN